MELWVPHRQIDVGRWITIHLRLTNTTARTFWMNCDPLYVSADLAGMFDPGRDWTGRAAEFKERQLSGTGLVDLSFRYRTGEGIDCPGGDIGQTDTLTPGQVLDIDMAALPRYFLRRQALPGGAAPILVDFRYDPERFGGPPSRHVALSAPVTIERRRFPWPSPGQIVDAAIATPGFLEWLNTRKGPRTWDNTTFWGLEESRQLGVCFFGPLRPAPNGLVALGIFAYRGPGSDPDDRSIWGGSLVDPWTLAQFGFTGNDGNGCPDL